MCGISGIINLSNQKVNNKIKRMNAIINHRGPDDEGIFTEGNIAFGHRRLSIIDLSCNGHQPMIFLNQLIITFNGEIYNYLELKTELITYGYTFKTNSDTEVILASYHKWGQDCIKRFNGMWAFAIYDKPKNLIFMSRDRFGIKPFYFYQSEKGFYFASEIKQFTVLSEFKKQLNKKIALRFLAYGELNTSEETFFEEVYELKGGYNLIYDLSNNSFKVDKWYSLVEIIQKDISKKEATEKFYEYFQNSIKLRLRSDVKVGCLLSGGLDSSSIVSMVDELTHQKKITTISSCFNEKEYDEQEYIDEIIKEKNVEAYKIFPEISELFSINKLDKIIWYQDQPFLSASHFAEYLVFEQAKETNLKVVLDGQGADETLLGYHEFFSVYLIELLTDCNFKTFFSEMQSIKKNHQYSYKQLIQQIILNLLPDKLEQFIRNFFNKPLIPNWIDLKGLEIDKMSRDKCHTSSIFLYSLQQLLVKSVPYQLHSEDRNSMAHSIESRIPFLDYKLVEFILSLPNNYKIKEGTTKYILRESLEQILPTKIKNRQNKMGFVTPEEIWMKNNSTLIKEELNDAICYTQGMINKEVLNDFEKMLCGEKLYSSHYFRIITFYRWLKVFEVKV